MTPSPRTTRTAVRRPGPPLARPLAALSLLALLAACGGFSSRSPAPEEPGTRPLVVDPSAEPTLVEVETARSLLEEARGSLAAGDPDRAAELAGRVVEEHAGTPASGPALLVAARAEVARGRPDAARELADWYAGLLPPGDPREAGLALLRAEERVAAGEEQAALAELLALPVDLPPTLREDALERVRGIAGTLDGEALGDVLQATPLGQTLSVPVMVAYADALRVSGSPDRAARMARAALDLGAAGPDAAGAREVLERVEAGDLTPAEEEPAPALGVPDEGHFEGTATVGALLPTGGSPSLRSFAGRIEDGIRVALEGEDAPEGVRVAVEDAAGSPDRAAGALRAVTAEGAAGIVGPLRDDALLAAADARTEPVPIISPTALGTHGRVAVYTLGGPDPGAARALADYAVSSGFEHVVVIHPTTEEHAFEASVFRTTMMELGGSVLRVLTYPVGTTTFGELLETARYLEPDALVLPIPPEDVQALAPQVSFFGLDTLGIRVLGTAGWTADEVAADVAPRHTDGVIVATPRPPEEHWDGYRRFEEAYERHFRRSLRDPVPALGYDAASLLLAALRTGARTPDELRRALESIRDFPGATGILSVEEGRVVRRHHLACIQDGELLPVRPGERPVAYRPERRGDPERGEPERVPLGPLQLYCPGVPPPDSANAAPGRPGTIERFLHPEIRRR